MRKGETDMFICSVRATTLRFLGVVLLSVGTLVGVSMYTGASAETTAIVQADYTDVRTEADRQEFLKALGYEPSAEPLATEQFTLPKHLDTVLLGYNEIQKQQGLDLQKYAGKSVTRYTYALPDEKGEDGTIRKQYANLIVYRHRIVAADLTCPEVGGFVKPLG